MKDPEIDHILNQPAPAVDPALLARITASLGASLAPVRPLPAPWKLIALLILIWSATASAASVLLGAYGIAHLSLPQTAAIFPLLTALAILSASLSVAQIIPGSRQLLSPRLLLATACAALLVLFPLLFQDYTITNFLRSGNRCLTAGISVAFPAGLLAWLVLRRGYAVNRAAAGLAAGTLAGLTGVTMLELHCPNLEVFHVLLWHTAVIPVSALASAAVAAAWPPLETE